GCFAARTSGLLAAPGSVAQPVCRPNAPRQKHSRNTRRMVLTPWPLIAKSRWARSPEADMVAFPKIDDLRRVLDDDGGLVPGAQAPVTSEAELRHMYRTMLLVRMIDERMLRLQRQGRLGFYMTSTGEEATHMAVAALRPSDWIFPSYREPGAAFFRGHTLKEFIAQLYGNEGDLAKGRQMPVHHAVRRIKYMSISSPVGTQIPQAVGAAQAARISGADDVVIVYFGEGATSTGEFHVAMNFAGVWMSPCIFFCRNNGWAISTPGQKQ